MRVCACVCVTSTFLYTLGRVLWNAQFGNDLQKKKGFEVSYITYGEGINCVKVKTLYLFCFKYLCLCFFSLCMENVCFQGKQRKEIFHFISG